MSIASLHEIRTHFPALERKHNGYSVAYFDGPGGTQAPKQVAAAITDYLYYHNANTHWAYPTSAETDELLASARQTLADFLNTDANEIAFGANMTTLTYHLARTLARGMQTGDEIVVTELDHHANIDPWRSLQKDFGVKVRMANMAPEKGQLDWQHLESLLNSRTRVLAIGAASNALGTINDIGKAVELAHDAGAFVFVDAVHYAPHELVDVRAWNCDFLACSAYKFYGPHVGVLYGRHELLQSLDFPRLSPAPAYAPENAETGTLNHEGIVGAAAAVDFLASLANGASRRQQLEQAFTGLKNRGKRQLKELWQGLSEIPDVTLYGPSPEAERTSTLAFVVQGLPSTEVCRQLASQGLFLSHGDFYAETVVRRLGLAPEGLVRVGCACYTSDGEISRLVRGVAEIVSKRRAG